MIANSIERLQHLCDRIPALLSEIDSDVFSAKSDPGKWSKKEIIGHLIDSATHNHHRLVRGQFEDSPRIVYDQDNWNRYSYYQQMDGAKVIAFWAAYNRHFLELIRSLPEAQLACTVYMGGDHAVTFEFVITDYVRHMEHHLRQVLVYDF